MRRSGKFRTPPSALRTNQKSLSGITVVITRPRARASALAMLLRGSGARVEFLPVIKTVRLSQAPLKEAVKRLGEYDGVLLTSVPAAEYFLEAVRGVKAAQPALRRLAIGVVGSVTASTLKAQGVKSALVPSEFRSARLAQELTVNRGSRWLFPQAVGGLTVLADALRKRGGIVDVIQVYRTESLRIAPPAAKALGDRAERTVVTCTSPSTVVGLFKGLGASGAKRMRKAWFVSIGPTTSAALKKQSVAHLVQAPTSTMEGMWFGIQRAADQIKKQWEVI